MKHTTLGQVTDHLLGEERISPRALGNPCGQVAEGRIRAEQLGCQRCRLCRAQRPQRDRLRARYPFSRPRYSGLE